MTSGLKLLLARNRHVYRWTLLTSALARFLLRRPHDPDFAAFATFPDRPGTFLDIGANYGQSAMAFRIFNRRSPILSIEANPLLERDLRLIGRVVRPFEYLICAAGEENGSATLHVPVFRGLPLTGEASLDREAASDSWWVREQLGSRGSEELDFVEVSVEVRRLDDLELEPAFVKIDVEGAEGRVLRGMSDTVARHRPIFLIEDAGSHAEVSRFFAARGYESYEYVPRERRLRRPIDQSARNPFYLPPEAGPA